MGTPKMDAYTELRTSLHDAPAMQLVVEFECLNNKYVALNTPMTLNNENMCTSVNDRHSIIKQSCLFPFHCWLKIDNFNVIINNKKMFKSIKYLLLLILFFSIIGCSKSSEDATGVSPPNWLIGTWNDGFVSTVEFTATDIIFGDSVCPCKELESTDTLYRYSNIIGLSYTITKINDTSFKLSVSDGTDLGTYTKL